MRAGTVEQTRTGIQPVMERIYRDVTASILRNHSGKY
jgi:hypothetical protein